MQAIVNIIRRAKAHALYRYLPKVVDWAVKTTTASSRKRILEAGATRLLIDNTIVAHAITHETGWISTGSKLWGGKIPIDTGFLARIPVQNETDNSDAARSIRFLPAIASLAQEGVVALFTSPELVDEQMTQPMGRFSGYGYYDYSLLSRVSIRSLRDSTYYMSIGPVGFGGSSLTEQRRARLANKADRLFGELLKVFGPNNSQDAWHIATAENNGCFCFLTMDFRLLRAVAAQRNNPAVSSLKSRVMSPEQFGMLFGLRSVSPRLYSYHGASYPVRADMNWPDSRRQRWKRGQKK